MPFYEYECSNCRYYSEVLQKITDKPLKKCPSCGKNTFKKLISAPVFRLKGSGWYETDFKGDKDNKRNLAAGDKDDAPAKTETAAAATDGKTDGKVEGKTDAAAAGKADTKSDAKSEGKAEGKSEGKSGKAESASTPAAAKPPAATTRNIAARRGTGGKSATAKRAGPAKRKAGKRRGGR
jgi:putative FmdB family regulatory protein